MSNAVLKGNASGTGTVTIESPNTNTDRTVTIPDATGTVMVSGNMPAFSVSLSSNTAVSSGVATKIPLNSEDFDTNSCYDNTTNYRFTPTVAGYYQLNCGLVGYSSSNSITQISVALYKNGSSYSVSQIYSTAQVVISVTLPIVVYANGTTDYFESYATITGSNLFISGGSGRTSNFSGSLVRAA